MSQVYLYAFAMLISYDRVIAFSIGVNPQETRYDILGLTYTLFICRISYKFRFTIIVQHL